MHSKVNRIFSTGVTLCFRAGVVGKDLSSGTLMSIIICVCLRDQTLSEQKDNDLTCLKK